ncbi:MAG: MFS transporter [Methanocalculus sp. MSAO_Arc2]|uniref:MFS transporter n=1 Tax=Methanocalculus sp. MSAO_Arc2 TaxID=2293855 RepID=UPI000FF08800|nr:MAG: MFS transporter [Methanocalculus sp. MSAO_Arc2]
MKIPRSILGYTTGHIVIDLYSPVIPALIPLLVLYPGIGYFLAGLLVSVFQVTSSLFQPVVGWLSDRSGWSAPIWICILASAVCIGLYGVVQNYYLLLFFAAGAGLSHALFHPSALMQVHGETTHQNRGSLTSIFVTGGNLGFAIGPVIVGILIGLGGISALTLIAIPGIIMAAYLYHMSKNTAKPAVPEKVAASRMPIPFAPVSLIVTIAALRSWVIMASVAFFPAFLIATMGTSLVFANAMLTLMLLAGVCGQVTGGFLSDRFGRKEVTILGLFACLPPYILFFQTTGWVMLLLMVVIGYLIWSTFSVTVTMAQEYLPDRVGLASGLLLGFSLGAGGLGVSVVGIAADYLSLYTALFGLAIPLTIAALLSLALPGSHQSET